MDNNNNLNFSNSNLNFIKEYNDPDYAIQHAIIRGDLNTVKEVVKSGYDVNKIIRRTLNAPLHLASHHGKLDIVNFLISKGADVNKKSRILEGSGEETPLHDAAHAGHPDIVERLIQAGANVNALDANERTPLDHLLDYFIGYRRPKEINRYIDAIAMLQRHGATYKKTSWYREQYEEVLQKYRKEIANSVIEQLSSGALERRKFALHALMEKHKKNQLAEIADKENGADGNAAAYNNLPPLERVTPEQVAAETASAAAAKEAAEPANPVEAAMKAFRNLGYRTGKKRAPRKLRRTRRRARI